MQHIAVDCRFASFHAGLGRYTRELVTALVAAGGDVRWQLIVRSADEDWIPTAANVAVHACRARHYSLAEQVRLPLLLRRLRPDVLFSPHFNVPLLCPVPFVVCVHDLILHRYPNNAHPLKQAAYHLLLRRCLARARAVVAVSRFTASELRAAYGDAVIAKTQIIGEGVGDAFSPQSAARQRAVRERYAVERPFFLYVGNAKQHKNVPALLEGYRLLQETSRELVLVTGGPEAEALSPLPPGVRLVRDVDDSDLPALYSAALAFVTASLYEGFCLPVAEAQACGCPVIASNRAAIPEVAAENALLVEPVPAALCSAMRTPPPPSAPARRSWEEPARTLFALLQSVHA